MRRHIPTSLVLQSHTYQVWMKHVGQSKAMDPSWALRSFTRVQSPVPDRRHKPPTGSLKSLRLKRRL
ncbi:MAG: hypothetical protein EOP04_21625 [Proteobacteria bacterium]|nr:MAG: hypothetical protein EOP04_21625 [Pseudomonadota bacterium]